MEITIPELKEQYLQYYTDIGARMTNTESIMDTMFTKIEDLFDKWGITAEKKSELMAQTSATLIPQFEQILQTSVKDLITLEHDVVMKDKSSEETVRKIQYYDDRLLETIVEKQSDLASFAVNANSDSAQVTINDLKTKMATLQGRVIPLDGVQCPPPDPVISIPTGINIVAATDLTMTVGWNNVQGATLYQVFRDGIQIASTGNLSIIDDGLTQLTKYAYNVKAFSGGLHSDLSQTVIGATLETII